MDVVATVTLPDLAQPLEAKEAAAATGDTSGTDGTVAAPRPETEAQALDPQPAHPAGALRIRLMSDLHMEFRKNSVIKMLKELDKTYGPPSEEDKVNTVCVLAGDIGYPLNQRGETNSCYVDLLKQLRQRYCAVLVVPGNHDCYQRIDMQKSIEQLESVMQAACEEAGAIFLQRQCVTIKGIRFVGCTLWSDITRADYKRMNDSLRVFQSHDEYLRLHYQHLMWLTDVLSRTSSERVVVVTHHLPSPRLCHPRFGDAISTGFATDLDAVIHTYSKVIRLWLCGHTHESMDMTIHGVRCVTNPLGYPNEQRVSPVQQELIDTDPE